MSGGPELRGKQNVPDFVRGVYDHRPLGARVLDALAGNNRRRLVAIVGATGMALVVLPGLTLLWLFLGFVIPATVVVFRPLTLPMRLPIFVNQPDPHDPKPGDRGGFESASGRFLLGYEDGTGKPIWASVADILRHFLLMGVTGAGKTER